MFHLFADFLSAGHVLYDAMRRPCPLVRSDASIIRTETGEIVSSGVMLAMRQVLSSRTPNRQPDQRKTFRTQHLADNRARLSLSAEYDARLEVGTTAQRSNDHSHGDSTVVEFLKDGHSVVNGLRDNHHRHDALLFGIPLCYCDRPGRSAAAMLTASAAPWCPATDSLRNPSPPTRKASCCTVGPFHCGEFIVFLRLAASLPDFSGHSLLIHPSPCHPPPRPR